MPVRCGNDWQQIRGRVVGTLEQEIPMTDYRELEDKARSIGSKWTLEVADAIKALREENERLGRALIRYGDHCTTADQEPCGGNAFSCTCGFSAALSLTASKEGGV
jgi:hypothetical protein